VVGDSTITVLRIDPQLWELDFLGMTLTGGGQGRTAKEWCEEHKLVAAVNAGMFGTDYKTHVGYLRHKSHVNSDIVNNYESVAVFNPLEGKTLPPFRIVDLDDPSVRMEDLLRDYGSVAQNLRLIKRPRSNRWSQQERSWSEAALGEDVEGRILLVFTRSPFTMHDFNAELITSDIDIVAAQHLEGGPEAQLYVRVGNEELELFDSYETSFLEHDGNDRPWPIPNVFGIRRRQESE
jgi:hypothetical protein